MKETTFPNIKPNTSLNDPLPDTQSITEKIELKPKGDWKMSVEEFSFAGCHYNSSCD